MGSDPTEESDFSGVASPGYIFFNGKRTARLDLPSATVHYYFANHLGSTSVVTSNTGAIQDESDFYPFGGERVITDTDPNHYKFTGKERDTESNLDNFGARYYSSQYGRFISADWSATPIPVPYADFTDPQTLNLYAYVRDNPISKVDADGHEECFANGACNSLRNPLPNTTSWGGVLVNAAANTVSDLLSLNEVAKGSVDVVNAETSAGKIGTAVGLALVVGLNVFTGGEGGTAAKGAEVGAEEVVKVGGRLGGTETRALDKAVAEGLEKEGHTITHGAGRPQEYIPGPGGGRKGSSYPDITAVKEGKTARVNTVDTLKDGATLTSREQKNANKIKTARPNDEFRTVPKQKKE